MDPRPTARRSGPGSGSCPQEDALDQELTVAENLAIYGRYFDLPRAVLRPRIDELLEFVQLSERAGRPGRPAVGRDEATAGDRPGADQRPGAGPARRADHRPRSAGTARAVGAALPAQAARHHPAAHDPLHGRGRAAVRPAGRDGPGPDRGRGRPAGADRRPRHPEVVELRFAPDGDAVHRHLGAGVDRAPRRGAPDRTLVYADDGEALVREVPRPRARAERGADPSGPSRTSSCA
jgi:hypothetical protein